MRPLIRLFVVAAGLGGCVVAARWAVLAALADLSYSEESLSGTEKAIALAPGNAPYYVRRAFFLSESQPERAREALRRAIALNPLDSRSRIELGLLAELHGDYPNAERLLLEAAANDKLYLPAWTLANYYFRREDTDRFWIWAKAAGSSEVSDKSGSQYESNRLHIDQSTD